MNDCTPCRESLFHYSTLTIFKLLFVLTCFIASISPVSADQERTNPHGFGFDTAQCISDCERQRQTGMQTKCCEELCRWKSCRDNSNDPGAAAYTECSPHLQIYKDCLNTRWVHTFTYWSTRKKDGTKWGPHTIDMIESEDGSCEIRHPKGHKCVV
jgi:hypothetical protein